MNDNINKDSAIAGLMIGYALPIITDNLSLF